MNTNHASHLSIAVRDDWQQLVYGHNMIRQLQTSQGIKAIRAVLNRRLDRYFKHGPSPWPFVAPPNEPSIAWACVYLTSYHRLIWGGWRQWYGFAKQVLDSPDFEQLPLTCQSHLLTIHGWTKSEWRGESLPQIIKEQQTFIHRLETVGGYPVERALHHELLGRLFQQLRQPKASFDNVETSIALLEDANEPFYLLQTLETKASNHYFLKDFDPTHAQRSIHLYHMIRAISQEINATIIECGQYYNLGWAYAEEGLFEDAETFFRKGYKLAHNADLKDFRARCLYGEGYVCIQQGFNDIALGLLREASASFFEADDLLKTAMCLQLEATIQQEAGKLDAALNCATRAHHLLKQIHNPVQQMHVFNRLVQIHRRRKAWRLWLYFMLRYHLLRRILRK